MNMVYNMMGYGTGMMGGSFSWGLWIVFCWLIGLGLVLLVWLWVIKLWREVAAKKKK